MTNAFTTRIDGPAPEVDVSNDMSRRGLIVAPAADRRVRRDLGRRRRVVVGLRRSPSCSSTSLLAAGIIAGDGPDLARG